MTHDYDEVSCLVSVMDANGVLWRLAMGTGRRCRVGAGAGRLRREYRREGVGNGDWGMGCLWMGVRHCVTAMTEMTDGELKDDGSEGESGARHQTDRDEA